MDPNLLSFFSVPNNQTLNPVDQNAESSSSAQQQQQQPDPSSWQPTGLDNMGLSGRTSGPSGSAMNSFDNNSTAPSDISFTQAPMISPYTQHKAVLPTRGHPRQHMQRKKDAHDRKRTKVDTESALESLDYWIQFDDDEVDRAGSFEIDFSKRFDVISHARPPPSYVSSSTTPGLGTNIYATAPAFKGAEFFDDNALDNALSDDEDGIDSINLEEQLSKIETMPPPEVPPREGLYSTPLSWEKPEPGLRMEQAFGLGESPGGIPGGYQQAMPGVGNQINQVLSNEEQRRLLAIAMNTGRTPASFMPPSGFGLGFGAGLGTGLPPEFNASIDSILGVGGQSQNQTPTPADSSKAGVEIKRETSSNDGSSAALSSSRPQVQRSNTDGTMDKGKEKAKAGGDRTAHNDIERKYRTNLKDKISELRDAVPALKSIPEEGMDDDGESSNPQRAPKVSKGTVLTKATEYIQYLERRNKAILKEHQELARRLQAFEQLLSASARQPFLMPNHSRTLFDPRGFC